ncbi:hypothetical protein ACTXT7_006541 [Hymenolepis weldensis]
MSSNSATNSNLANGALLTENKNDQNVIKPYGWAIPMYPNDVAALPLTHESSAINANPLTTNTQPVALLVPSIENGGSDLVPPNCYLVMDGNGPTPLPASQKEPSNLMLPLSYNCGGSKTPRISTMGLECLDGVEKIWIHQKLELFESKCPLFILFVMKLLV